MIIWRGLGILVVVAAALAVVLMQLLANALFGAGAYQQHSRWFFSLGLLIAAAVVWPLGRYLNSQGGRVVIDKQTGQELTLRRDHSLFFIKMEYWAPILAVLALLAFVLS